MLNLSTIARTATVLAALAMAACASSPQYVAADDSDDFGHYSTKLADNRYRVVYNGNDRINLNKTKDYALLRAAELTLQEGYSWFEVVDRATTTKETGSREPHSGVGVERSYEVERNCGLLGCSERVRPSTTVGMHVETGSPESAHSYALEVLMGNGEIPEKGGNFYDASSVAKSIWERM
ncbi:MAG: hypothetical protein WBM54_10815 [Woeseia sp.]